MPTSNNIATLVSPDIISNLKSSIDLKAFGDQLKNVATQKVISTVSTSTLANLYKQKEELIVEGITLDVNHSNKLRQLEKDHTSTKQIEGNNVTNVDPKISDFEYQEAVNIENSNYEAAKKILQERKDKNNKDIDNVVKDPFKKQKDEAKRHKISRSKVKTKNKQDKQKSKTSRRKAILNNSKKTLVPILTLLLSDKISEVIAQNNTIKKLVDDTNVIIEAANLSNEPTQLENAKIIRDNAIRVIQSNEDKIRRIVDQIKIISTYITIFSIIITVLTSIPIPTSVPPGVGIPVNLILKMVQLIDKANRILLALSAYLPLAVISLEKAINILEEYKAQLLDINGLLDNISALSLDLNSLLDFGTNLGEYKGFKFALKEENNPKFIVRGNKRHYAVAINKSNVEVLKSEYSFTLDPNDLVEQLKLIIDQQNLQS